MTSGDLKYLLQGLADDGAELVELDKEELVPRIRSRRRRRAALTAAVAASTAVMLAAGAYAVLPGGGPEQWPVAGGPPTSAPTQPADPTLTITTESKRAWDACGARLTETITGDPSLRISVTTQKVKRSVDGASGWVSVQVSNTTGRTLDLTGQSGGPALVVVKDGVVVGRSPAVRPNGRRWVFTPRQTATVVTALSLRPCEWPGGRVLKPGSYQLYALMTFNQNLRHFALFHVQAAGGPWTIEVS